MGHLQYGSPAATFEIEDRALAHIELVTLAKLRRNEPFALSLDRPDGRSTLWINPAATLRFDYDSERPAINREWLDVLIESANTTAGLRVLPEP